MKLFLSFVTIISVLQFIQQGVYGYKHPNRNIPAKPKYNQNFLATVLVGVSVLSSNPLLSFSQDNQKKPVAAVISSTSSKTKLSEEINYEKAVSNRDTTKYRLKSAQDGLKFKTNELSKSRVFVKKYESEIKRVQTNYDNLFERDENDDRYNTLKKTYNDELETLKRSLAQQNAMIRNDETAIGRLKNDIDTLNYRLKEDEKFVNLKKQELVAKQTAMKKDLELQEKKRQREAKEKKLIATRKLVTTTNNEVESIRKDIKTIYDREKKLDLDKKRITEVLKVGSKEESEEAKEVAALQEQLKQIQDRLKRTQDRLSAERKNMADIEKEYSTIDGIVKNKENLLKTAIDSYTNAKKTLESIK